jgi:signal transduction histidine kinase
MDRGILRNIITNLLSNAIKYSPEDKDIDFISMIEGNDLKFTIKDSGIGIPDEEQKYLFERFFRAKNASNIQGTGLGLNIVKKYVDLLGGEVSFSSAENEGTTFTVIFDQNVIKKLSEENDEDTSD